MNKLLDFVDVPTWNGRKDTLYIKRNFLRLIGDISAIILVMIRAVIGSHLRGIVNGHLDYTSNYLFRSRPIMIGAKVVTEYECHLMQNSTNDVFDRFCGFSSPQPKDMQLDMSYLKYVIDHEILGE